MKATAGYLIGGGADGDRRRRVSRPRVADATSRTHRHIVAADYGETQDPSTRRTCTRASRLRGSAAAPQRIRARQASLQAQGRYAIVPAGGSDREHRSRP